MTSATRSGPATLSAVARTTVSAFIWTFAVLAILGIFSINLGPLIAGAGIAGIAVGLGAQQLVKDCISGFFILLEDQCGVGDEIDIGPAIGTVESITLRSTTLRDGAGTVWTVPNGTVLRIGNKSRDWSLGTVDVTVTDAAQLDDAVAVIERVAAEVSALPDVAPVLLEPIAVPGVESLGADGAVVRAHGAHLPRRPSAGDARPAIRADARAQRRRHRRDQELRAQEPFRGLRQYSPMTVRRPLGGLAVLGALRPAHRRSSSPHRRHRRRRSPPQEFAPGDPAFYDVPEPLPSGAHGDLVRWQVIDSPFSLRYRMMYLSETVAGEPTLVTALVDAPDDAPAVRRQSSCSSTATARRVRRRLCSVRGDRQSIGRPDGDGPVRVDVVR